MPISKLLLAAAASCSALLLGPGCKDAASTIAEKTVTAAKETSKGLDEGAEKGRKSGESLDGATLVSSAADLAGKGDITVYEVRASDAGAESKVVLAVENTTDKPLRLTKLDVVALDKEGFVQKPSGLPAEVTIAPKAKDKISFVVPQSADKLAKLRFWGKELVIADGVRK
jgi:hypothetical protein